MALTNFPWAMKRLAFLFFSLIGTGILFSQPCFPDGLTFNTQAQIDSFNVHYPECTTIGGTLKVREDLFPIYNLHGLLGIDTILGSLHIQSTSGVQNLHGWIHLNGSEGAFI